MDISSLLISLAFKSTIILIISLGVVWGIKRLSSSERHLIWCLAFMSLILLPVLTFVVPKYQFSLPFAEFLVSPRIEIAMFDSLNKGTTNDLSQSNTPWIDTIKNELKSVSPGLTASVVYFLVFFVSLLYLGYIYVRINGSLALLSKIDDLNLIKKITVVKDELDIKRNIGVLQSKFDKTPWTWGIVHPCIILPASFGEWPLEEQRNALIHELFHIKRFDLICFILTRFCCCLYWFHPLVWIGYREIMMEAEKACDDRVIFSGTRASSYATQLTNLASSILNGGKKQPLITAMARYSTLTQRINSILAGDIRRDGISNRVLIITFTTALVLSVTLVAFQVIAKQPDGGNTADKFSGGANQEKIEDQSGAIKDDDGNKPAGAVDMRKKVYEKLTEVQNLFESGKAEDAISILEELAADTSLSSYERAQVHNYFAYIYFKTDKYDESIHQYLKVLEQQDIPKSLKMNTTYTLSQLYFMEKEYTDAIERMNQWLELTDKPTAKSYIILGQAYYELNNYKQSIVALNKAYNLHKGNSEKPGRNLLLLMRLDYWNLEDQGNIDRINREIRELYPDSKHDQDFEVANNINALNKYLPINKVEPVYPPRALKRGIEGYVVVEFTITKGGETKDIHVVGASHTAIFDKAALQAVAKFRYKPVVVDGKAIEVPGVRNKIVFVLEDKTDQK